MKRTFIGMFVVILFITTSALPVLAIINDKDMETVEKITKIEDKVEPVMDPPIMFVFGRIENKYLGGIGRCFTALNLRIFNFGKLKYYHLTSYEEIEVGRFGLGIFTDNFICGFYQGYIHN